MKYLLIIVALVFMGCTLWAQDVLKDTIPGSEVTFELKLIEGNDSIADFYIGTHEVTYDMFALFKRKEFDTPESDLDDDYSPDAITRPTPPYEDMTWGMGTEGGFPAVSMTQKAAMRYCEWLYQKTGRFYRLPTAREWTYVAKKQPSTKGWFYENSGDKYHQTGTFQSDVDIYDLYGNVMEWTLDKRVLKGGSYIDNESDITADTNIKYDRKWQQRDPQIPKSIWWLTDGPFVGFRLHSPVEQPTNEEVESFFKAYFE
ncbi:formylglycine-generating enzyme family protein [Portibacter marinus]|uniref:formylglycine-generating enzyme family protein n=1 Tax=Portibacter marinus TaxID=2898660 RepID=UPI001F1B6ABF|nr:SUMF1/EgtB/PvdO family nonheme iron enzyme [Portibacter marinus]